MVKQKQIQKKILSASPCIKPLMKSYPLACPSKQSFRVFYRFLRFFCTNILGVRSFTAHACVA